MIKSKSTNNVLSSANRRNSCKTCSQSLADQDFNAIQNIRENIIEASSHYCINSNLVEGMISKLTRAGSLLDENGWVDCLNGEQCYGNVENFTYYLCSNNLTFYLENVDKYL